ncbi:MAG: zinc-ribbon domain-containing protein [Ruminococcus sp.]|nr:zinc-ribbon domain-containing protein [Ruminococcus sp.]
MFCRKCGGQIPDGRPFCPSCGTPADVSSAPSYTNNVYNVAQPKQTSGLAVASLILGILALVLACFGVVGIICGILAVIMGGVALASKKGGKGMAIAGLVCGLIAIVPAIIVISIGKSLLDALGF